MKRLSPEQTIQRQCRWCMNNQSTACRNNDCPLRNENLKPLERIQNYCLRCVPEQDINGVKQCTGEILSPKFHICSLHTFRLGKL